MKENGSFHLLVAIILLKQSMIIFASCYSHAIFLTPAMALVCMISAYIRSSYTGKQLSDGYDPMVIVPRLAAYLGHKSYRETCWYIHLTVASFPELSQNLTEHLSALFRLEVRRMRKTDFTKALTEYFSIYLPTTCGVSPNTTNSYRDTFKQLLLFSRKERHLRKLYRIALSEYGTCF